jgi:hypothetical protein
MRSFSAMLSHLERHRSLIAPAMELVGLVGAVFSERTMLRKTSGPSLKPELLICLKSLKPVLPSP